MPAISKARPAETTTAVLGTGGIIAAILADNWLAAALAAIGYVPAIVTYLVANGGIRGVFRSIWRGRDGYSLVELMAALFLALLCAILLLSLLDRV